MNTTGDAVSHHSGGYNFVSNEDHVLQKITIVNQLD